MSSDLRDGPSSQPELGSDGKTVSESPECNGGRSDEDLEVASREARRIAVLVDRVMFCYSAGQVRRWHAMEHVVRTETIAAHTWNVVMWVLLLHPEPSKNLVFAAMVHDVAEKVTGDMPRWIKQRVSGMNQLEAEVLDSKKLLVDLDPEDEHWLQCLDLFDAWLFLRQNLIAGNRLVADNYQRATLALSEMNAPKEVQEVFNALRWEKRHEG